MALQLRSESLQRVLQTKQGKTYTVFGVTVFTVILMFMLAVRPAWISITGKLSENSAKRIYIQEAQLKRNNLNSLGTLYAANEQSVKLLYTYLPEEVNESFVDKNLTGMAEQSGVQVSSIRVERPIEIDPNNESITLNLDIIAQSNFTMIVQGDLNQMSLLVENLEKFGKIINISSLSYTTIELEDIALGDLWQMSIKGSFYFWDINNIKEPL